MPESYYYKTSGQEFGPGSGVSCNGRSGEGAGDRRAMGAISNRLGDGRRCLCGAGRDSTRTFSRDNGTGVREVPGSLRGTSPATSNRQYAEGSDPRAADEVITPQLGL